MVIHQYRGLFGAAIYQSLEGSDPRIQSAVKKSKKGVLLRVQSSIKGSSELLSADTFFLREWYPSEIPLQAGERALLPILGQPFTPTAACDYIGILYSNRYTGMWSREGVIPTPRSNNSEACIILGKHPYNRDSIGEVVGPPWQPRNNTHSSDSLIRQPLTIKGSLSPFRQRSLWHPCHETRPYEYTAITLREGSDMLQDRASSVRVWIRTARVATHPHQRIAARKSPLYWKG